MIAHLHIITHFELLPKLKMVDTMKMSCRCPRLPSCLNHCNYVFRQVVYFLHGHFFRFYVFKTKNVRSVGIHGFSIWENDGREKGEGGSIVGLGLVGACVGKEEGGKHFFD